MAAAPATAWPDYARVVANDYSFTQDSDVRRTQLDDGMVRQSREYTEALTVRSVEAVIASDADVARMRSWADEHAHAWFAWTDTIDGQRRRVRVRGGAGGIEYRAVAAGTDRAWRVRCELEGLWSDEVPAVVAASGE